MFEGKIECHRDAHALPHVPVPSQLLESRSFCVLENRSSPVNVLLCNVILSSLVIVDYRKGQNLILASLLWERNNEREES